MIVNKGKEFVTATTNCAAEEQCVRPTEWVPDCDQHWFAGYGWFAVYHRECCPRSLDGTDCDMEH